MRKLLAATLFVTAAAPLGRADDAADAAKKLEGTYTVVDAIRDGQPNPKAKKVDAVVIKDVVITVKSPRKDEPARFTLDPSKKPAHIDLKADQKELPGIYEVKETADGFELTIAFARGGDRPKDFKGEGDGQMVMKLRRKKDAK